MQIHVHTHNCTQTYKFILSAGFSGKGPEIAKRQRKEKKKKKLSSPSISPCIWRQKLALFSFFQFVPVAVL